MKRYPFLLIILLIGYAVLDGFYSYGGIRQYLDLGNAARQLWLGYQLGFMSPEGRGSDQYQFGAHLAEVGPRIRAIATRGVSCCRMSDHGAPEIAERYSLGRELGRGTTGRVYAAWDHHLERDVAVKVLDAKAATDSETAKRFEAEIRVTARLQHPGVVAVYEAAHTPRDERCYVMSLAHGRTLDDRLCELRQDPAGHWPRWPLADRLTLFLKLLDIIGYAHSRDVVHRDLKPANIIIGQYGEVWVLDWGLARLLRSDPAQAIEVEYDQLFRDGGKPAATRVEAETVIMPEGALADPEPTTVRPSTSSRRRAETATSRRHSQRLARYDVEARGRSNGK